jgi:hypothetical protein
MSLVKLGWCFVTSSLIRAVFQTVLFDVLLRRQSNCPRACAMLFPGSNRSRRNAGFSTAKCVTDAASDSCVTPAAAAAAAVVAPSSGPSPFRWQTAILLPSTRSPLVSFTGVPPRPLSYPRLPPTASDDGGQTVVRFVRADMLDIVSGWLVGWQATGWLLHRLLGC